MAQQEKCRKCARYKKGTSEMRCSFYAAKPQYDDKPCIHFEEKRPLYGMTTQSQTNGESIMDCYYRGPWYKRGRRESFFEKHVKLDKIITIVSSVIVGIIMLPIVILIWSIIIRIFSIFI